MIDKFKHVSLPDNQIGFNNQSWWLRSFKTFGVSETGNTSIGEVETLPHLDQYRSTTIKYLSDDSIIRLASSSFYCCIPNGLAFLIRI